MKYTELNIHQKINLKSKIDEHPECTRMQLIKLFISEGTLLFKVLTSAPSKEPWQLI